MVENGFVTEGTSSTAFILDVNGTIRTQPLGHHILPGVTRRAVLRLARGRGPHYRGAPLHGGGGDAGPRSFPHRGLGLRAAGGGDRRRSRSAMDDRGRSRKSSAAFTSRKQAKAEPVHLQVAPGQAAETGRPVERGRGRGEPQGRRRPARRARRPRSTRSMSWRSLSFCAGSELKLLAEAALKSAKAGEIDAVVVGGGDGSIRTVAGVLAGSERAPRHSAARHAQSFRQGSRHPARSRRGGGGDRQGRAARGRSRRGQWRDLHQQFLDRHLSLSRDRSRTAAGAAQARQMDGDGAGLVPRARGIFRAAGSRSRPKAGRGPTARPAFSSATTNMAWSFPRSAAVTHLDQGELSVYVVKQRRPLGFFWMVCRLAFGKINHTRDIESFRLEELRCARRQAGCLWRWTARSSSCTLPCIIAHGRARSASSCLDLAPQRLASFCKSPLRHTTYDCIKQIALTAS